MARIVNENGWLLLLGGQAGNEISIKPTDDLKKIWGRVNDVTYSIESFKVTSIILLCNPDDKVWIDARLTQPFYRLTWADYYRNGLPKP